MEIIGLGLIPLLAIGNIITLFFWYQDWKLIKDLRYLLKMKLKPTPIKRQVYTDDYLLDTWEHIMAEDITALEEALGRWREPKTPSLSIVKKESEE